MPFRSEQHLVLLPFANATGEFRDGVFLIAAWLVIDGQSKAHDLRLAQVSRCHSPQRRRDAEKSAEKTEKIKMLRARGAKGREGYSQVSSWFSLRFLCVPASLRGMAHYGTISAPRASPTRRTER